MLGQMNKLNDTPAEFIFKKLKELFNFSTITNKQFNIGADVLNSIFIKQIGGHYQFSGNGIVLVIVIINTIYDGCILSNLNKDQLIKRPFLLSDDLLNKCNVSKFIYDCDGNQVDAWATIINESIVEMYNKDHHLNFKYGYFFKNYVK